MHLNNLQDSVTLTKFTSDNVTAYRFGNIVVMYIAGNLSINGDWGITNICTCPFKPLIGVNTAVALQGGGSGVIVHVATTGTVSIEGKSTNWRSGWIFGTIAYAV